MVYRKAVRPLRPGLLSRNGSLYVRGQGEGCRGGVQGRGCGLRNYEHPLPCKKYSESAAVFQPLIFTFRVT